MSDIHRRLDRLEADLVPTTNDSSTVIIVPLKGGDPRAQGLKGEPRVAYHGKIAVDRQVDETRQEFFSRVHEEFKGVQGAVVLLQN